MHTMLFVLVFMIVLFVFLSGLKKERLENQRKSKVISRDSLPNVSKLSSYGCPIYEDHFTVYNRMPIIA